MQQQETDNEANIPIDSQNNDETGKNKKNSVAKRIAWTIAIVLFTPVLLLCLLIVALYLPPVQNYAVDKASEYLSEQTGMDVTVGDVHLKFPLDLSMGDVVIIENNSANKDSRQTEKERIPGLEYREKGDTILAAGHIDLGIKLLPLIDKQVEIDRVTLTDTKLNTKDLIDALTLKGNIGELKLSASSISLINSKVDISEASLHESHLTVSLADSVPEDTTESEPTEWIIGLNKLNLHNVGIDLKLSPQADKTSVGTFFPEASISAMLDLKQGDFTFTDILFDSSMVRYDVGEDVLEKQGIRVVQQGKRIEHLNKDEGFNTNHIVLNRIGAKIDTVKYMHNGDLTVLIDSMKAEERAGLNIDKFSGRLEMDSLQLRLKNSTITTADSKLFVNASMDLNAFDEVDPGIYDLQVYGSVGKDDLRSFTREVPADIIKAYPNIPIKIKADISGNLIRTNIKELNATFDGKINLDASGYLENLNDSTFKTFAMSTSFNANASDISFIKGMMPKDVAQMIKLPKGLKAKGTFDMSPEGMNINTVLRDGSMYTRLKAFYNSDKEIYDIDADTRNLNVNRYTTALTESLTLSGSIKAKGKGADIYDKRMTADADISISEGHYDKFNLSNSHVDATLKDGKFVADIFCDNPQLATTANLNGSIGELLEGGQSLLAGAKGHSTGFGISGTLNTLHADLRSMGLTEDQTTIAVNTTFNFNTDGRHTIRLAGMLDSLLIELPNDTIHTSNVYLNGETTPERTKALISSGDMSVNFVSPYYFETFSGKISKLLTELSNQQKNKSFDINRIKKLYPEAEVFISLGQNNPIHDILNIYGISYDNIDGDFTLSPEIGINGNSKILGLNVNKDSLIIDSIDLTLQQDSDRVNINGTLKTKNQRLHEGFSANIDAYLKNKIADAHIKLYDNNGKNSTDLGINLEGRDSLAYIYLYPDNPVIGFKTYHINKDNYITLTKQNRAEADIHLNADDGSKIDVTATRTDSLLQNIQLNLERIDLHHYSSVLPMLPQLGGMLNLKANYRQTYDYSFTVDGRAETDTLKYEGTNMGNIDMDFSYKPTEEDTHNIRAVVYSDDKDVAVVEGYYKAADEAIIEMNATLARLPLSLAAPFIPDQIITLGGFTSGNVHIHGNADNPIIDGMLLPDSMKVNSEAYGISLRFENDTIPIENSQLSFDNKVYGYDNNPVALKGYVDMSSLDNVQFDINVYGRNFALINTKKTKKSIIYGKANADLFAHVVGTPNDITIRGLVNILAVTDLKYVLVGSPLTVEDRLSDIVTFVDFNAPPPEPEEILEKTIMGVDMNVGIGVEEGAKMKVELSTDQSSYINLIGNGNIIMKTTPEGVFSLQGRYTFSEGEMKYQLPVVPLKTFKIQKGSYVEFVGDPVNPVLNITATERTKSSVPDADGGTRSVTFDTGVKISNTLKDMGLEFIIDAPDDQTVKNEIAGMSQEEKNKAAVAMLATGMFLSDKGTAGFRASNALNSYLQSEINQIAGRALNSFVDMNVGIEQTTNSAGQTHTDYSFQFSKRLFSERLNVIIGGKVSSGNDTNTEESGTFIDDVSLEWRLDKGGTKYLRLFHERNYDNLFEGEVYQNGGGVVLRKKVDKFSELFIFKNEKKDEEPGRAALRRERRPQKADETTDNEANKGEGLDTQKPEQQTSEKNDENE